MGTLVRLEDITDFLNENNWHFDVMSEPKHLRTGFRGIDANFDMVIELDLETDEIRIVTLFPFFVSEHKRKEVCELLVRLNLRDRRGGCNMDLSNGGVFYRITLPVDKSSFSKDVFERLFRQAMVLPNWAYPAFMSCPVSTIREGPLQCLCLNC